MPFIVPKPDLPMLLPWLKAALPASFKIYQDLHNYLNGKWPGLQFIVDQWPEPKAVLEMLDSNAREKAQCEDFLKRLIVALYADDSQALCELLQDPEVVDWSTRKTFCAVSNRLLDTVAEVCSKHGQCTSVSCYLLMAKPDATPPMPVPDGMKLLPVDSEMAEVVARTWKFNRPESADLIKAYVKTFPSLALVTNTGRHVGHMVGDSTNCMGMLYIQPEFRRRGFAKIIISNLSQLYFQHGANAYVIIEVPDVPSLKLHTSIGFQIVSDIMLEFVVCHPRNSISS